MMPDSLLKTLERRIDEHHACLHERLDRLEAALEALRDEFAARMQAHEVYHRQNEHRFGLMRLAERHPLRLALVAFACGGVLLTGAPHSMEWLGRLIAAAMKELAK